MTKKYETKLLNLEGDDLENVRSFIVEAAGVAGMAQPVVGHNSDSSFTIVDLESGEAYRAKLVFEKI